MGGRRIGCGGAGAQATALGTTKEARVHTGPPAVAAEPSPANVVTQNGFTDNVNGECDVTIRRAIGAVEGGS